MADGRPTPFRPRHQAAATRRALLEQGKKTVQGTNLALEVANQIGKEFRIFQNMSFWGRIKWMVTGKITISAKIRAVMKATIDNVMNEEEPRNEVSSGNR